MFSLKIVSMNNIKYLLVWCLWLCFWMGSTLSAHPVSLLGFENSSVLNGMPNKDVQSIYQDADGYLWISTRNGLFQYDGYSIITYKSNLIHPDLMTSNNVFCVAEDSVHRLWIGTYSGLNMLDKRTRKMTKVNDPSMNGNSISRICVTRKGEILFATDRGLYEYREEENTFVAYGPGNTGGVLPQTSIKALMEDDRGDLWIGTWSEGLYRREHATGKYYRYPRLNEQNSAHALYQDSRGEIWVGTWRGGLVLLKDAYDFEKLRPVVYRHRSGSTGSLSDDIVYAISENEVTGDLWIGTRKGLSLMRLADRYEGNEDFRNYVPNAPEKSIESDEVTSLVRDRQGLMWVGMIGGGVFKVNTRKADFVWDRLEDARRMLGTTSVRSMLMDEDGLLWMGIGTYGLAVRERGKNGGFTYCNRLPEFSGCPFITTVMAIMEYSVDKHIWVAAYDDGVYEIDKNAPVNQRVKHYLPEDSPWLVGSCAYYVYEDSGHNLWFATRNGISMRTAGGEAVRFDSLPVNNVPMKNIVTNCLVEGKHGDIWGASGVYGVFRLQQGDAGSWQDCMASGYSTDNGKLNSDYVECLFRDTKGRIWAGTGSSGLNLYDEATDAFLPVHKEWNLPGDAVVSIREDGEGHLWLGTNVGLIKLTVDEAAKEARFHLYTTMDGLQDNIFVRGSVTMGADGEMFFGGHRGYNSFYPDRLHEQTFVSSVMVTDIKVFNQSWSHLPEEERFGISAFAPSFAREIRLNHHQNNFSIEFSALEYANPERNRYAYKLEGFDVDWQYTNASQRFAYYNNLSPGSYNFLLKSSNTSGMWSNEVCRMKVVILPPPWETWWAYTLYILVLAGIGWYIYCQVRNRIRLRDALRLREMEKARMEEVNHAKLQFFTNITHELLTPLTILSASVEELKRIAPVYKEQYRVMNNNINRQIRLLQQILEFRKAETGNLKLKVSQLDLALFVRRSLDSFRPLIKKKEMIFSLSCPEGALLAYFDPDKLDKILYNLLSNASKYNRPGGKVGVELTLTGTDSVRLVVRDDGPGIPKSAQKELFKRFYEGDYRKFKTIGTGIGLSLVRDLVMLHHGTVTVESEEGKGSAFIVTFPILREAYANEEVDEELPLADEENQALPDELPDAFAADEDEKEEPAEENAQHTTLLLVEDNEDLLQLMVKLLKTEYTIHTATNGKEALSLLEQYDIDLIVSDVMMPEMDGFEFCSSVKGNLETCHIPVILLTAKKQEEDRIEAYESGADAFITKPFNLSVLYARINNLLRIRERMRTDVKRQQVFEAGKLDITTFDEHFLQGIIESVNKHLSDPDFSQAQVMEEMHISKSTLYRKVKALTGLSCAAFIANIRMKAACRILTEKKRISVSELAYAVGYSDPRYFSNAFKREFGMRPSEYMRKFTTEGVVVDDIAESGKSIDE